MYKTLVSTVSAGVLLIASVASAQVYYPTSQNYSVVSYPNYTGVGCVSLSRDLSIGSRGSEVTQLQNFLVTQNYPGGGSWMVTGYFGQATAAAVRNYQAQRGLPMTGAVDSATRASISTCGSAYNSFTPFPTYPTYPTYPSLPTYPSYPIYPVVNQPMITSLSTMTAAPNTMVTIYGTNLQYGTALVRIGGTNVSATSVTATSLSFIVPNITSGSYQVSVLTNAGTSNSLAFSVTAGGATCGSYWYGAVCPLSISHLSTSQGAIGSTVTIYGTGFSTSGNTVRFGQGVIANLNSYDGTSLSFTVPSQLTGFGSGLVYLGTYQVSVTNASGQSSNAVPFTVTSLGSLGAPTISGVSGPSTLQTNTTGSWSLTLNTQMSAYTSITINWGDTALYGNSLVTQTVYTQGTQSLSFTHAYQNPGTYTITFTASNASGQANSASATVIVSGSGSNAGPLTLSYVSPSSGRIGTQVMLVGSGFTSFGNTVRFGQGGIQNVISQNGSTIYYTIPSYLSPCDVASNGYCAFMAQQVTPGTYPISVTNQSGTTNTVQFTVTQ